MEQFETDRSMQKPAHHKIHRHAIMTAIVLFVLIVVGMFTFTFLKKTEIIEETVQNTPTLEKEVDAYAYITQIEAKHYFIDDRHTLVGDVPMPTPCELIETKTVVMESLPEQVLIDFTVFNNADACITVITDQRFKVSIPASEGATFSAKFMGRDVELNLVPAGEDESPDDFELFSKG